MSVKKPECRSVRRRAAQFRDCQPRKHEWVRFQRSVASPLDHAIVVYNDAQFTDDDFRHVQTIGDSGKPSRPGQIGRFGRGFNTAYNVTDTPTLLSSSLLAVFDPHERIFGSGNPGLAWRIV